ncbi:MAG: 5'-nucleotidase C-terminal domain-containing protein [Candidatus Cloacimonetes bacterium]|nr:5'-nucleotidase C-terminal domain-containing protein [Candidatus Cloacimonadota bacterium]
MKKLYILCLLLISSVLCFANDLTLDIIFTNDLHGGIDRAKATFMNPAFPPQLGGGASAATYIKSVREKTTENLRDNLLIDTGDFFQGRPIGSLSAGKAVIEYMNMVKYDLLVLGNHEYDLGEEKLKNTLEDANFPILAANVYRKGTLELVEYAQPFIIVEKMGLKIGIVGITTTDTEKMSFADHIRFVDFIDEKEVLQYYVNHLRDVEKVDIVIATVHAGIPYDPLPEYQKRYENPNKKQTEKNWGYDAQELAHEVEGIDLMFAGHIHKGFDRPWVDPITHTLVFQGYAYGSGLIHLMVKIDPETKTISGFDTPAEDKLQLTLFEDQFIPDPEVDAYISEQQTIAEKGMDEVVGIAGVFLSRTSVDNQNAMGNFTCEAMRDAVNADFSFINLGGIRAEIPMGNVTYRHVFNAMPFDNMIVTLVVDGIMLKRIIETRIAGSRQGLLLAGGKIRFNKTRSDFDRVTLLEINGEPWDPNKRYKVATTDFLLQGNAGLTLLTTLPESQIIRHEINLRDAMVDYFKQNSPVKFYIDERWERNDKSTPENYLQNF